MKKVILLLLIVGLIISGGQNVEASQTRINSLGGLEYVVEDLVTDMDNNPAQLIKANNNQIVLNDINYYSWSKEDDNRNNISANPTVIYKIDENMVVGGKVGFNNRKEVDGDKFNTIYPNAKIAYRLNEDLSIGGAFTYQIINEEDAEGNTNDSKWYDLKAGINYNVNNKWDIDGSIFYGSYVDDDFKELRLYSRGIYNNSEFKNTVVAGRIVTNDGNYNSQMVKIGQNYKMDKSLLAYGLEVYSNSYDNGGGSRIVGQLGYEKQISNKLTLRLGDSFTIMETDKENDTSYFSTPRLYPSIGLAYEINNKTKLDFDVSGNYYEKEHDGEKRTRVEFSVTRLF